MKDLRSVVREYAQNISEGQLEVLTLRLTQKLQGDVAYVLDVMSGDKNIDSFLSSANSADEFFYTIDQITQVLQQECKKKRLILSKGQINAA